MVGVDTELRYSLLGYGIPIDFIPVTGSGNIKVTYLKQGIHVRNIIETEARSNSRATTGRLTSEPIVECPGSNDVVFKPGKRLLDHPGNIMFQSLILSKESEYTTTSSKRSMYRWLTREIREKRKGRFLKWNDDEYWTEILDERQITLKISTSCKTILRKARVKKNETSIDSSTSSFQNNDSEQNLCSNCKRKREN
jgi:hypothetical protein